MLVVGVCADRSRNKRCIIAFVVGSSGRNRNCMLMILVRRRRMGVMEVFDFPVGHGRGNHRGRANGSGVRGKRVRWSNWSGRNGRDRESERDRGGMRDGDADLSMIISVSFYWRWGRGRSHDVGRWARKTGLDSAHSTQR